MDKCPKCGAEKVNDPLGCAAWGCGSWAMPSDGRHCETKACLRRQLAAANEKLSEAARLADDTRALVGGLTADLVAANGRAGRLEKSLRSLCERLDEWWYEADPMDDVKKGERHPWTKVARKALEVPDAM